MPQVKLNDVVIRNLPAPPTGQQTHWDTSLPGFGVRVSQGGTKSFVVIHGANRRRYTIGRFGPITLKQARDEAKKLQAGLTLGLVDKVSAPTFDDAKDRYLDACRAKNRPRTVTDYERHLRQHFPFGRLKLSEITRADIQKRLIALRSTPSEQHHAFVVIKVFLNWAVQEELIDANPIASMKAPHKPTARERVLSLEELQTVYQAAQDHPWPFGPIVQLLVLTGQRRGEIAALQWDWIDEDERIITFPASATKNRQTHRLPYGEEVARLLQFLPQMGPFVFPARNRADAPFNGWSKCKERFDNDLEGVDPYTLHDLRRTFSSMLAMLGTPIHVTERLLNHKSGTISGVAAVYNRHSYMEEMRSAVAAFEGQLRECVP